MLTDRSGLEVTTPSVAARDAYVAAVDRLLAAYLRAEGSDEARPLLARRTDRRPTVPVTGLRER